MSLGIGLDNFLGRNDLSGMYGNQDVNDVLKAMSTSGISRDFENNSNINNSWGPLKYDVLDSVLHVLTYRARNIVLWNTIPKSPCTSNVIRYAQQITYGVDDSQFVNEGQIPSINNLENYIARSVNIKYLAEKKRVTSQAMQTNAVGGDVMNANIENATLSMLGSINRKLLNSDEAVIPTAWNGYNTIHRLHSNIQQLESYYQQNPLVINAQGGILTEAIINQGELALNNQYGYGDTLFTSPKVIGDWNQQFSAQRIVMGTAGGTNTNGMNSGVVVNTHNSPYGPVNLYMDQFLTEKQGITISVTFAAGAITAINTSPTPGQQAPLPPTATFLANSNNSVPGSWSRTAGMNSLYVVRALNVGGESAVQLSNTFLATQLAAVTNGSVDMTVINNNSSIYPATGYVVYRTMDSASTAANFPANGTVSLTVYPILTVSANQVATTGYNPPVGGPGLAANVIRDSNFKMPNTQEAFIVDNNPLSWNFLQWLPMNKLDLGLTEDARTFVLRMWGAPVLYEPNRYVRIMNLA